MPCFVYRRQISMCTHGQPGRFPILDTCYNLTLPSYQNDNMRPQRSGAEKNFNNHFSQYHCATKDVFIPPDPSKGRASESNPEDSTSRLLD
jgi:hypothetical protein